MSWNDALYSWLVRSALVSLVVLAAGSGAVLLCRQPTRRVRIITLSLIGCLVAPWLGMIPGYPQLAADWRDAVVLDRREATPLRAIDGTADRVSEPVPERSVEQTVAQTARQTAPHVATLSLPVHSVESVPAVETAEMPANGVALASWIVALYLLGVAIGAAWWLVGLAGLARILWTAQPAPPLCRELLGEIAGRRGDRVRLLVSRCLSQPFAAAWGRPVIVVPQSLCGDGQSLRWCLAHEWSHVERRDFRVWLMAGLVRVLFFYHPLVWWLRRQLRLCQDFVADAHAARQAPQPEDYAEFLTVRAAAGSLHPAIVGLGMGFRKSELYRRIVMLVQNHPIESRAPRLWSVSVTLAGLILIAAVAAMLSVPKADAQGQAADPFADGGAKPAPAGTKPSESQPPFTARLPNGITVELLGVCENPSQDRRWWRPDGSPLAERPYDTVHAEVHAEKDHVAREVAVLLRNLPAEPVSVELLSDPAYNGAGGGLDRVVKDGTMLEAIAMSLPAKPTVTIRVGVAAGPWQTVKESQRGDQATGANNVGVAFSHVYEKDGGIFVAVAHNISGPQSRVVAVDNDGKEHAASSSSGNGAGGFHLLSAMFSGLSLKDIQVFRLQSRPYQWLEFRDVSLHPGHKTRVTTVVSVPLFEPKARPVRIGTQAASPIDSEAAEKIKEALAGPTQLEFVEMPLQDVVDYLKDYHGIEIQLDKKAMDDVGIGSDTPITKNLKGITLRSALRLLLKEKGLTYVIQDEMLLITTPEEADNHLETTIYPVGDLVLPPNSTAETQPDFDSLMEVIKTTVKPATWDNNEGPGSIVPFENNLSITVAQTQEVHEEIARLLEKLRAVSREQGKEGRPLFKPRPKTKVDAALRNKAPGGEKKPAKSDPPVKP